MREWVVAVALAFLVSGCLGGDGPSAADDGHDLSRAEIEKRLTQPLYEKIQRHESVVSGADDAGIWVEVYRPADAETPVPVILVKTPYQGIQEMRKHAAECGFLDPAGLDAGDCAASIRECAPLDGDRCPYIEWLIDYFAPRGYAVAFSDVRGNHNSGGCSDQSGPKQWEDGYHMVEWLAAQTWSNGKVGMYGASYDAETQITTALLNPPGLKTIVPSASVSNQYEFNFYDGVAYTGGALQTAASFFALSTMPGSHPNAITSYPQRLECQDEVIEAGLDSSGDWSEYWEKRDYRKGASGIEASVLQTHGLHDANVKPNHLDGFWNELTSEKRLVVGQWEHSQPQRADWLLILHRWYDHYLHGIDTGILADLPPVLAEDTRGRWHGLDAYPPETNETVSFWPAKNHTMAAQHGGSGALTIIDPPRQIARATITSSPFYEHLVGKPSHLVFETGPLNETLHTMGRPLLHLHAETDEKRTRWAAQLILVGGDGNETLLNRGYMNTRHRDGPENPQDLEPDRPYSLTLRMFPQNDVIPAGTTLRLVITNTDDEVRQDTTYATSKVRFGPDKTRLELPLKPPTTSYPADRLRDDL